MQRVSIAMTMQQYQDFKVKSGIAAPAFGGKQEMQDCNEHRRNITSRTTFQSLRSVAISDSCCIEQQF